jgi:hypothetical protein
LVALMEHMEIEIWSAVVRQSLITHRKGGAGRGEQSMYFTLHNVTYRR